MRKINLSHRTILLISLACSAFFYAINFNRVQVGVFTDDAHYVNAARYFAGAPNTQKISGDFPLGYPAALAPAAKLFPESLNIFRAVNILFFLTAVFMLFLIFKDFLKKKELLFLLLLCGMSPLFVARSSLVMSEGFFLLLTLMSFYLLQKAVLKDSPPYGLLAAAAFFGVYAGAVRFEGFIFAGAIAAGLVLMKKHRHALYFVFFYVIMTAVYLKLAASFTDSAGRYFHYFFNSLGDIGGIYDILQKTSEFYFIEFTYSIFLTTAQGMFLGRFAILPAVLFFAVFAAGFSARQKIKAESVLKIYFVLYVLAHLLFPSLDPRFFLPLAPLAIFYFLEGVRKFGAKALNAVFACFFLFFAYTGVNMSFERHYAAAAATYDFIKTETDEDAVFLSIYPAKVFLYTNRRTIAPFVIHSGDDILYSLVTTEADYVFVDLFYESRDYIYMRSVPTTQEKIISSMANEELFQLVYRNEQEMTAIWRAKEGVKEKFSLANEYAVKALESLRNGDSGRAKELYAEALRVFPFFAHAVWNYSHIYLAEGNVTEAERILKAAAARTSHSSNIYALYAHLLKLRGEFALAADNYEKARQTALDFNDREMLELVDEEIKNLEPLL